MNALLRNPASILLGGLFLVTQAAYAGSLTLETALKRAMGSNPEIASMAAMADAEHSMIRSESWLESPKIGFMREKDLNLMEQMNGPMNFWTVAQDVKFPTKYFLLGSAQRSKSEAAKYDLSAKQLEVRRKVISAYYGLFSTEKVLTLLAAQRETLREIARTAESKHATGMVSQQDEMKAHTEETQLETEVLMAQEEKAAMIGMLDALLNEDARTDVELPESELSVPSLTVSPERIPDLASGQSRQIKKAQSLAQEADTRHELAVWNYAPDFMFLYKRAYTNAPNDNYSFEVDLTIPLWFFMKNSSEASAASSMSASAQKNLEQTMRDTSATLRELTSKVTSHAQVLKIYQTALIPQASTTLASSQAAYRAGKIGFVELVDSERSLYMVQTAFYRTLAQYVEYLTRLEETVGSSLSTLPHGDHF